MLNVGKNKLKRLEQNLEDLESSDNIDVKKINEYKSKIKNAYEKQADAARIRSKVKWYEEGEQSSKFFFDLEKKNGTNKLWYRIKCDDGTFKDDIDSILKEQTKFYEKLFTTEGWDRENGHFLIQNIENKLDETDKIILDKDLTLDEIRKSVFSLKKSKSPGEDGIIAEFYQKYWEIIKDDMHEMLLEIFTSSQLSDSQYKGMLSLLYKNGERESIKNWRPITLLNTDYKIVSKLLAERLKKVIGKIIHPDQKGFVPGRNINEANRMIQDIIDYFEETDDEGIIVFLDQQKAFDRVEWGWINDCLKAFNFGDKFCDWIQMLLKHSKTCIKTNGFVSKYFSMSRSTRQGCPIAPLLYIIQAEPMACAIRANNEIKGLLLPTGDNQKFEAKINMFADDTQLFNKDEDSVKKKHLKYFPTTKKLQARKLTLTKQKVYVLVN